MELNKILDEAIMLDEMSASSEVSSGYITDTGKYDCYMSNSSWQKFCCRMKLNRPETYDDYNDAGGKELDERKSGAYVYPPKMASFGSSSRFIYTLMEGDKDFCFEVKLPTTVGGVANLDGFKKLREGYVFVEAKCREPYSAKNKIFGQYYYDVYKYINDSQKTYVTVDMDLTKGEENEMAVVFRYDDEEICHFDIKQMISHLLGVGTAFLEGKYENGPIRFVYLLFNPVKLTITNVKAKNKIDNIYADVCNMCRTINFNKLFEVILEFLQAEKEIGTHKDISEIIKDFSFELCDQYTFVNYIYSL